MSSESQVGKEQPLPSARFSFSSFKWFCLILAVLVFAAFPEVLIGSRTFFFRDYGLFSYPLASHLRESLWRGELPFWNPNNYCGLPFLAQWNTMALYPPSLVFVLLPMPWALSFFCLLHAYFGGLGMYMLARQWTSSGLAATVAGVAFVFSGIGLNSLMWHAVVAALAWMPWVVLWTVMGWRQGGRVLVPAILAAALQLLAGSPEIVLLTWSTLTLLLVLDLWQDAAARWKVGGRFVFVFGLALGISAVQLLPFLDFLAHSQRTANFSGDLWAIPLWGWANYLLPLFRTLPGHQGIFFQPNQDWATSYYLGIGTLLLAVIGVWKAREHPARLLVFIMAGCLILALGKAGGLYTLLAAIFPSLKAMRYPVKFTVLVTFAGVLLSAFGTAWLERQTQNLHPPLPRRVVLTVTLVLALGIGLLVGHAIQFPLLHSDATATWKNGLVRGLLLAGFAGLLLIFLTMARWRFLASGCLLLLIWADALTQQPRQTPTIESWAYETGLLATNRHFSLPPVHGQGRVLLRMQDEGDFGRYTQPDPVQHFLGCRQALYLNLNLLENIPSVSGLFPLTIYEMEQVQSLYFYNTNNETPLLSDFMGVKYVTAPGKYFEWLSRPTALPLVTAGQRPVYLEVKPVLRGMKAADFAPADKVFLEVAAGETGITNQTKGLVTNLKVTPHLVAYDVETEAAAWTVIAQAWYHCWEASVDAQPARVWRANHAFQAVSVPAGKHHVILTYRERWFFPGLTVSAACLIATLGVLIYNLPRAASKASALQSSDPPCLVPSEH